MRGRAPVRWAWWLLAASALALGSAAQAVLVATASAAGEEDDDNVWSVETLFQKTGSARGLSVAPEYAFDPRNSIQFELGVARDRSSALRSTSFKVEYKHLFNSIARDGWGIGLVPAVELKRQGGEGWKTETLSLHLPVSWQFSDSGALLHLNAGINKPREGRRELFRAAAVELPLFKRLTVIAEIARTGDASVAQLGVRHWIKRERFALDVGVLRTREGGGSGRENGWLIGLSWFDL